MFGDGGSVMRKEGGAAARRYNGELSRPGPSISSLPPSHFSAISMAAVCWPCPLLLPSSITSCLTTRGREQQVPLDEPLWQPQTLAGGGPCGERYVTSPSSPPGFTLRDFTLTSHRGGGQVTGRRHGLCLALRGNVGVKSQTPLNQCIVCAGRHDVSYAPSLQHRRILYR